MKKIGLAFGLFLMSAIGAFAQTPTSPKPPDTVQLPAVANVAAQLNALELARNAEAATLRNAVSAMGPLVDLANKSGWWESYSRGDDAKLKWFEDAWNKLKPASP